jgi:hypothetical protein
MFQQRVRNTMTAHLDIRAMEMFANQHVETMKTVWPTNDAFVAFVELFAITTLHVDTDKFVRIAYAKLVVEPIRFVKVIKLVLTNNVPIHVR